MELNNLMMNNNVSYKIISDNQKIENDKERIKSKFNFNISRTSTNSSAIKQSNIPTQKNSIIVKNFKSKENSMTNFENKIIKISGQKQSKNTSKNNSKDKNKMVNLSHTNIIKREQFYIKTNGSLTSNKKKKNNIPYNVNNSNINKLLFDKNNINNNYNNITDNSNKLQENQNNLFKDSILQTQPIIENIDTNIHNNEENKNNEQISIEKEISDSFKKSSFSCSSKTSEMHNDILNMKGGSSENEGNIEIVNN